MSLKYPYPRPEQRSDGCWLLSDLHAASYLHARGQRLVQLLPWREGSRSFSRVFVFRGSPTFELDFAAYEFDEPIRPKKFVTSLKALLQLLRSGPAGLRSY
jgi:hypothetical protein